MALLVVGCQTDEVDFKFTELKNFQDSLIFHKIEYSNSGILLAGGNDWTSGYIYNQSGGKLFSTNTALYDVQFDRNEIFVTGVTPQVKNISIAQSKDFEKTLIGRALAVSDTKIIAVGGKSFGGGGLHIFDKVDLDNTGNHFYDYELRDIIKTKSYWFAVGYGAIMRSIDGEEWTRLPYYGDFFTDIIIEGNTLYIMGQNGLLYKSNDGGNTLEKIKSPPNNQKYSGIATNRDELFLSTLDGQLFTYHFIDKNWKKSTIAEHAIHDLLVKSDTLWACGDQGYLGYLQLEK